MAEMEAELVVSFSQTFTVKPPAEISDPEHARQWFWEMYADMGWDVIDPERRDHYEIIAANRVISDA